MILLETFRFPASIIENFTTGDTDRGTRPKIRNS